MKIENSPLYKSLCEGVRKQDHAELLRMLKLAEEAGGALLLNQESLIVSFVWEHTPQGYDYWRELHFRLRRAGHRAGATW